MFRIWRGDAAGCQFKDFVTPVEEGMVVLDAVHRSPGSAGPRSGRALELQGRQVRLVLR
jgi:hypothetical protein